MMKLKIQPPGDRYFLPLLLRTPRLLAYLRSEEAATASDGELLLVRLYESVFSYGIHRLYQEKWDSSHKNPVGQAFYRDGKPFCELLRTFLEVAEYTFLYADQMGCAHVLQWFQSAAFEIWRLYVGLPEVGGKAAKADELRQICSTLADSRNPFDPDDFPMLWQLSRAIAQIQIEPRHSNAVRNLLRSKGGKNKLPGLFTVLKSLATRLDKDSSIAVTGANGDFIEQNRGSGKGVTKFPAKNHAKSTKAAIQSSKGF